MNTDGNGRCWLNRLLIQYNIPKHKTIRRSMKAKTKLIRSGLQLTILAAAFCLSASAQAQVTLTELGAAPPTVGATDIAQLIAISSPPLHPDDLNYYWDNSSPPGQTFTTGGNASGYTLTSLALQTGGNGGGQVSSPFALNIYSVSGSMATLMATYTVSAFSRPPRATGFNGLVCPLTFRRTRSMLTRSGGLAGPAGRGWVPWTATPTPAARLC